MWTALLQWLRGNPALAERFSASATFAAVIVALFPGLLPIWLNQRDRKRRVRSLWRRAGVKACGCFAALTTFQEVYKEMYRGSPPADELEIAQKVYLLAGNQIEELVAYSEREEPLILPAKDYDLLADPMSKHRIHVSSHAALVEGRPVADQWHLMQWYMNDMLGMAEKLLGRFAPKRATDEQFPLFPEVPASPKERPQPSG